MSFGRKGLKKEEEQSRIRFAEKKERIEYRSKKKNWNTRKCDENISDPYLEIGGVYMKILEMQ